MKVSLIILSIALLLVSWSEGAPQSVVLTAETQIKATTKTDPSNSEKTTETQIPDTSSKTDDQSEITPPKTDVTTEEPATTPAPEPGKDDSSTQTDDDKIDWFKKGAEKINNLIKGQSDFAKGTVGVIGDGMKKGTEIGTAAGDLSTKLGQAALLGSLQLGSLGIDAGSEMGKKIIDLMKKWGNIMPGPIDKGVQSVANFGVKGIDQFQGISKQVLGKIGLFGSDGLQWVNGLIHKGGDFTGNIVDKGTGKIQSIIGNREKQATDIINSIVKG